MVTGTASKILSLTLGKFPVRLNVGMMMFLTCMMSYMLRVNFSMLILAMVKSETSVDDHGKRFDWDTNQQGMLLGAYFWGYLVSGLPGAMLAERFGGKTVTTYIFIITTVATALGPMCAHWGVAAMFVSRFITGFVGGPTYPALHNLIAKWGPPEEKGKFVAALMGGTFGTVITWPLMGVLIENIGWSSGFYVPAALNAIIGIMWYFIASNSPQSHKWIKEEEKEYIEKSLGEAVSKEKPPTPFLKIFTSIPFIALLLLHFGNVWGLFFLMTAAPKFINLALNFDLGKAGLLAALPYLARLIFGLIFGSIGDFVKKQAWLSTTSIRKIFTIFSHIIPGLLLAAICLVDEPYVCVAIITTSLGFNGAACLTNLQNTHDLAPNFAGLLYGIMNVLGSSAGFISPLVVTYFTKDGNLLSDWSKVFLVGAAFYIISALFFIIFGTGVTQSWNDPKKLEPEKVQGNVVQGKIEGKENEGDKNV